MPGDTGMGLTPAATARIITGGKMSELNEVTLPSGAVLKVQLAPFAEAKALYQAVLEEAKGLKFSDETEIDLNLLKDLFCAGFSSPKIEKALAPCLSRALYNDLKIDKNTFEPAEAREDYVMVVVEVAKYNLLPFTKSLMQKFSQAVAGTINKSQKSE